MTGVRRLRTSLFVTAASLVQPAFAAHPFISEDPGTQGTGHIELELGFASAQGDPIVNGRQAAFSPQLSIGVTPTVDFIVQSVWLQQKPVQAPTLMGASDTLVDVKWRFFENDSLAFAVRAGLDLPTGDGTTGLGAGEVGFHGVAIVGWTFGEYVLYGNAGYAYTRAPGLRPNLGLFSVALTQTGDAPLHAFVEAATYSSLDPTIRQWPAVARVGAIYTVNSWLDIDSGFQARLNRTAVRAIWLAGATLHW